MIGIAFLLILGAVFLWLWMDEPPPKDGDLRLKRLDISDEENAFHYTNLTSEDIYYPEDDEKRDLVYEMEAWKRWDKELAIEMLAKNQKVFDCFEKAISSKYFQVPEIEHMNSPMPYLPKWRTAAHLGKLRALHLVKAGKEQEALDEAMKIIKFGHMAEDSRGAMMTFLVGSAIKKIGHSTFRSVLNETTLQPEILKSYIEKLSEYEFNKRGLVNSLKTEYSVISRSIDLMVLGELESSGRKKIRNRYSFKPNATRRIFAEAVRDIIENVGRDYDKRKDITAMSFYAECTKGGPLSRNAAGKIAALMLAESLIRVEQKWFNNEATFLVTQVLIALKCYKLEHGQLPDSLNELVPKYIDQIPEDPYDGKPFKYSKKEKIVYSVWENMVDEGGKPRDKDVEIHPGIVIPAEDGDLIFEIEF